MLLLVVVVVAVVVVVVVVVLLICMCVWARACMHMCPPIECMHQREPVVVYAHCDSV